MTSSSLKQLKANGIVGQSRQGVITSPKGSTNIMDLHFPNYLVDATTSLKETKDTRRPLAKEMAKFGSLAQDSLGFAGESYRNDMRVLRPAKKDGKRDESLGRGMKKGWIDNPNGDFDDILLKTNKRPPGAGQTPSFIHKPAPLEDEILNIRYSYEIDIQVKKGKGESQALTNKSAALKKGGTVGEKAFHESGVLQSNQLAPYFVATGNSKRGFQSHVDPDQIVGRSRQSTRAKETSKVEQSSFLAKQTTMDTEENRTAQNDRVYTDGPEILGNVASGNSRRQRILRNIVPPVKRFGMKSEEDDQRNVVLPYDQRNNQVDQETQKVKQHYTVVMNPSRNGIPQPELNIQTEPDQPSMQPVRSNSVGRRGLGNRLALPPPEARPPSNTMKITRSESTQPSRPTGKKPTSTLQNFVTQVPQRDITKSVKTPPPLITDEYLKTEPASRTQDGPRRSSNSRPNEENTNTRASIRKTESNRQFRIKPIGTDLRSQSPKSYDPSPLLPSDKLNSVNPYYMAGMLAALKNPDETDYFNKIYRDHFSQTHQAMSFCRSLRAPDSRVLAQKRVMLSKREDVGEKKCLIFDLDETLVHCNENSDDPAEVHLPISFPGGETVEAGLNVRPYALAILKELSQLFEIVIFTASHSCYANVVLDYLDPNGELIHHRLFRDHCVQTSEGIYIKDLRVIGNRDLKNMVIVDNAAHSFGYQIDNGIPIIPFYDNRDDTELLKLMEYLKGLANVSDVREYNKRAFKFHVYQNYGNHDQCVSKLFPNHFKVPQF